MRWMLLLVVLSVVVAAVVGCGGKGEPSRQERETAAVERLLAEEEEATRDGARVKRKAKETQQQAQECLIYERLPCVEAATTLIEASNGELEAVTARLKRLHREINSYSPAALEAAFAASFSPSTNSR